MPTFWKWKYWTKYANIVIPILSNIQMRREVLLQKWTFSIQLFNRTVKVILNYISFKHHFIQKLQNWRCKIMSSGIKVSFQIAKVPPSKIGITICLLLVYFNFVEWCLISWEIWTQTHETLGRFHFLLTFQGFWKIISQWCCQTLKSAGHIGIDHFCKIIFEKVMPRI